MMLYQAHKNSSRPTRMKTVVNVAEVLVLVLVAVAVAVAAASAVVVTAASSIAIISTIA